MQNLCQMLFSIVLFRPVSLISRSSTSCMYFAPRDKINQAGWVARYRERPSNKVRRMYSLQVLPVISNKF